ncbi:phosphoglucosamine mutase [Candidatus Micrarchaeota archaeon]|nr:phosphoglucosamine mutase [Candidatus Micrarchaeota archaeon]
MAKFFGTNGVRGKFNELDPTLTLKLAQAIGTYFKFGKILVAGDCRLTGPTLNAAVISGLSSVGCEVIDLGIVSAPTAEFMIEKTKAAGCIIITASHNPPEWNALKVVDGKGVAVSKERGEEIEKLMLDSKIKLAEWNKVGKISKYELAVRDHIDAIKKVLSSEKIAKIKNNKIVLDCGNGAACTIAPKLFNELGLDVLTINSHMDGRFPGRPSEPTEANVKELIAAVKTAKADAGIAWDGDGDRVIFVDETGNYVIGDKVFALSIIWKLAAQKTNGERNNDIITTVATSKAAEEVAKKYGAKTRFTAIGAPYLCEEFVKKPGAIAGEEVGGVIWPEMSLAKDGFYTAAKMVEALSEKPLSKWLSEVPVYFNVKTKIEAFGDAKKQKIVARVLNCAKKNKLKFNQIDGVRIDFPDTSSWVIVRASGTENYVRFFAEAKTEQKAKELVEQYKKIATG